jgi:hypothetical protein
MDCATQRKASQLPENMLQAGNMHLNGKRRSLPGCGVAVILLSALVQAMRA